MNNTGFTALENIESEAATQELLAIPGLLERVKENQKTPKSHYKNWKNLRLDITLSPTPEID